MLHRGPVVITTLEEDFKKIGLIAESKSQTEDTETEADGAESESETPETLDEKRIMRRTQAGGRKLVRTKRTPPKLKQKAKRYNIPKQVQDEYGVRSQQRAAAALAAGKFTDEIAPMTTVMGVVDKATGRDRTSIMFSIADKVGALHSALAPFRRHRLNMTKIESRPNKRKAWEYFFFVDIDGHQHDKGSGQVLAEQYRKAGANMLAAHATRSPATSPSRPRRLRNWWMPTSRPPSPRPSWWSPRSPNPPATRW